MRPMGEGSRAGGHEINDVSAHLLHLCRNLGGKRERGDGEGRSERAGSHRSDRGSHSPTGTLTFTHRARARGRGVRTMPCQPNHPSGCCGRGLEMTGRPLNSRGLKIIQTCVNTQEIQGLLLRFQGWASARKWRMSPGAVRLRLMDARKHRVGKLTASRFVAQFRSPVIEIPSR